MRANNRTSTFWPTGASCVVLMFLDPYVISSYLDVTVDPGKVVGAVASVANGIGGGVVALGSVLAP